MNATPSDHLMRAIGISGSQQHLANILGVSAKTLNHWLNRHIRVPLQHALTIEVFTDSVVLADALVPHAKSQIENFRAYLIKKATGLRFYA